MGFCLRDFKITFFTILQLKSSQHFETDFAMGMLKLRLEKRRVALELGFSPPHTKSSGPGTWTT
jgi:hypothetical protein